MSKTSYVPDPQNTYVVEVDVWRDGGTISVELEDSSARRFSCCFDGILRLTPGRLYIDGKSTSNANAKLVPFNHTDQTTILGILQNHLDQHLTRDEQELLGETRGVINGIFSEEAQRLYLLWLAISRLQELTAEHNQTQNHQAQ